MEQRTLQNLEFDKVLAHLAGLAVSDAGAEACRKVAPLSPDSARAEIDFFSQGRVWSQYTSFRLRQFPPLSGMLDYVDTPANVLDLDDLWALRQVLAQAKELVDSIAAAPGGSLQWPLLQEAVDRYPWPGQSWSGLARCIGDNGQIRDESSPELLLVRQEVRRIHQTCTRKVKEVVQTYNLLQYMQDEYLTLANDRYVLPLKSNFKGRVQGIIHDYSQTGETCYFEPLFLVELNNELQELKQQEREEERKVLVYLTGLVRSQLASVRGVHDLLVKVDVLQAKCAMAAAFDGTAIELSAETPLNLRDARHPLLALTDKGSLPVNLQLKPGQKALVISGGNAGGKTVCLKTVGLITLMAMSGLPVPVAAGSTLPLWTRVFAFIGDEQSLEGHVSTFTAQIKHLSALWEKADSETLVILDEFGAGTDPAQGAALAQAVIDELLDKDASIAAATHFPALKAYALSREKVRAASVLFDPSTKKPLYRLAYDQVGASQALDVAREHGMPESVLRRAESYLLMDGEDTSALIDRLNSLAVSREKEIENLYKERDKFRVKRDKLEERFTRDREKLFTEVQTQAQDVLKDWKAGKVSHKSALKELSKTREKLVKPVAEPAVAVKPFNVADVQPGQRLSYLPWNKVGVVEEVDGRRNRVKIDLSGVSMWAEGKDLALVDEKGSAGPKASVVSGATVKAERNIALRLDLRGMRTDVALSELSRFLDKALLGSVSQVEIVHGRGTGILRKEVHRLLREFPAVSEFRLAPEDMGGDGMTIVDFR
ncbi:Smr/MutS family protein [Desulfovibrio mangrovi]|uniref:endonuclease MutS2 n=1 Tax=Desulfovibrio mangrovi TaxID=2976983 RepID=UPI00224606DD|nr:Smr/MutS family protein [Desulfovibrio mangrovi]UZP68385.1 Smr/MutS family protein [Desulfovibrio mangrovi]